MRLVTFATHTEPRRSRVGVIDAGQVLELAEQTRQCIRNMQTVLEAAGGTLDDIVSIVVYTTDIRQFKEIVASRMEFFKNKLPTSTIVEVNHLADPGMLIEFQATAAL